MLFDLISDFHVEMNVGWNTTRFYEEGDPIHFAWHNARHENSDVLVIAGDTANHLDFTRDVIVEASRYYPHVVFVDGNHEHYNNYRNKWTVMRDVEWLQQQFNWNDKIVDNVTYLVGQTTYKIGSTLFIGENGWYNFCFSMGAHPKQQQRDWRMQSNDPNCIRFGKKHRPEKLARKHVETLKEHVYWAQNDDTIDEIVVVTHTLPTEQAFGQFANPSHPFFALNGAYCNNWMREVWEADEKGKIKTWCFGHTHERRDFFDERGLHFVCNPRGYRGEKKWGDAGFAGIIQVDTEEPVTQSAFGDIEG